MSSTSNPNAAATTTGQTRTDQSVFNMLFGNHTCVSAGVTFGMFVAFALVATVLFVLLAYVPADKYLEGYVKNPNSRLALKAVIFFLLMLLIVWLFNMWFSTHPTCTEK